MDKKLYNTRKTLTKAFTLGTDYMDDGALKVNSNFKLKILKNKGGMSYLILYKPAKSLKKSSKQFASRRKRSSPLGPGSGLGHIYLLIHLFLKKLLK